MPYLTPPTLPSSVAKTTPSRRRGFRSILACAGVLAALLLPQIAPAALVSIDPSAAFRFGLIIPHEVTSISVFNDGAGNIQHSILKFDLSSIPLGSTITNATLKMAKDDGWIQPVGTQTQVFALSVLPDFSFANWTQRSPGVPWTTPGGDVTGPIFGTNSQVITGAVDGTPFSVDITPLVGAWKAGTIPNYGLLLTGTVGDQLHFHPFVDVNPALRPSLSVTFVPEPSSALLSLLGLGWCVRRRAARLA